MNILNGGYKMDIFEKINSYQKEHTMEKWEGTFRDYLPMVIENPMLSRRAHKYIYDAVHDSGVEIDAEGNEKYKFFEKDLFGIDDSISQIMEYLKAAAMGSDVGKRILLLYGPPSSGKSQLVILLKRGLEEYSRIKAGERYAISDCPQREDPLHLIPQSLRNDFLKDYNINIEGELCPMCSLNLTNKYNDIYQVPIKRILVSEKDRVGIGTFLPSDPKSQDVTELVGSLDLSKVGEYGAESDPRAYRFDGELNVTNRGLMEFIEMLKADEKFLYVLLTLAQEKNIKTGRFPLIYADEFIIAHTNEAEYKEFMNNKKSEALQDRMIVVKMPYNLKVSEEVKIYQKLLSQANTKDKHLAPHTLEIVAMFAVLSRLNISGEGISLIQKMKLYNGEEIEGIKTNLKTIKETAEREGMEGISPRFIINRISSALIKANTKCVNPIDALRVIKEGFNSLTSISKENRDKFNNSINDVRILYDEIAKNEIQKTFFVSFTKEAEELFNNYLDNAEAYLDKKNLIDPITGEEKLPDEKLMRSMEEKIKITESAKDTFRQEVSRKAASEQRKGRKFGYTSHPALKEAIEKQLFHERNKVIFQTLSTRNPDSETIKKLDEIKKRLVNQYGHCEECAEELRKYVSAVLIREQQEKKK